MSRERWLTLYCFLVGALGLGWMLLSGPGQASPAMLALFLILALLVESARFRVTLFDAHSLVGIVLLMAGFSLGAPDGALVAAASGFLFGLFQPLLFGAPRNVYSMLARPLLRSGVRAAAVLSGAALATAATGNPPDTLTLLLLSTLCYPLVIQLNRVVRELVQGGRTGVITWWRVAWLPVIAAEVLPLPAAWLGAAIYQQLPFGYFLLTCLILYTTSLLVRRASLNLQRQRRSVRELALLNQVSRAIIRSGLDINALSELIYGEASKLVDTSSFHLGLFAPNGDQYTLVVRVQDRVRLPPLTFSVPSGDGIIGWMRETGRSLLVHDFQEEMDMLPARPRYHASHPPRSGVYVPLIADDEVIGSISIQSYQPNAFDADDLRLLSLIADQAAVAIAKARAFINARQRAVQLQAIHEVSEQITAILDLDELLPSVVRLISEHFNYHPVHIFTLEGDDRLTFRASNSESPELLDLRLGVGLVGAAIQQGEPVLVNDVDSDARYVRDAPGTRAELAVPLRFGNRMIGALDVQTPHPGGFSDGDLFVMQTLAGQIATAIESARAFTEQREEAWTLNALLQVAENLAWASSLDELLPAAVRLPPLLLGCDRCYVLLYDEEHKPPCFTPLAAYGLSVAQREAVLQQTIPLQTAPLLERALSAFNPLLATDEAARAEAGPEMRSFDGAEGAYVAVALTARGAPLGVLLVDYNDAAHSFPPRVLTLYTGIAGQIAGALESALLAQEAAKGERLEQELRVARDIQTALLPAHPPQIPGWDLAADWQSARLVGGDFYDFWQLRSSQAEKIGFVVADVSDKGVPAAMFMTLSRSLVRAAALDGSSPSAALIRANRWITRDSDSGMFVTLFYGVLDPKAATLRYACAGHNPPLLLRAGESQPLPLRTPGMALGVLEETRIGEDEVSMQSGDLLVCYTDGVTEAINGQNEEFGVQRLIEVMLTARDKPAKVIVDAISQAVMRFAGDQPPFDDITLVVIKRDA